MKKPVLKAIEHATWGEIVLSIDLKVTAMSYKPRPKSQKEAEFAKFCRMMNEELFIFKEMWRDNTMHSISSYNVQEAYGVFERVKSFMQRLSEHISETN